MQFDINTASTRVFVTLSRELNYQLTEIMKKEWVVGDTKIKVIEWGH